MKPRIFLSHSSKDKDFIEKLANQLRTARIDVWFDEWEIPPGESIRKKIFDDGIPNCDVFFVYLTEFSVDSYWVSRELDAMITTESENRISQMALFVSKDEIRAKLSSDLRASNIPEFNEERYIAPFSNLLSRIWEIYLKKNIKGVQKEFETKFLSLENEKLRLEKRIMDFENESIIDFGKIDSKLKSKKFEFDGVSKNLKDLFNAIKLKLADGTNEYQLKLIIGKQFGQEIKVNYSSDFKSQIGFDFHEVIGELIMWQLIEVNKPTDELQQLYYLSDKGLNYAQNE